MKNSGEMNNEAIIKQVQGLLSSRPEIMFAYLHGSFLDENAPQDIDLAVYLREDIFSQISANGSIHMDYCIPLEMTLEADIHKPFDIQALNHAPLPFRARVISQGRVVSDNTPSARADFEYLSRYEYFDFLPKRKEYLAEVGA